MESEPRRAWFAAAGGLLGLGVGSAAINGIATFGMIYASAPDHSAACIAGPAAAGAAGIAFGFGEGLGTPAARARIGSLWLWSAAALGVVGGVLRSTDRWLEQVWLGTALYAPAAFLLGLSLPRALSAGRLWFALPFAGFALVGNLPALVLPRFGAAAAASTHVWRVVAIAAAGALIAAGSSGGGRERRRPFFALAAGAAGAVVAGRARW